MDNTEELDDITFINRLEKMITRVRQHESNDDFKSTIDIIH